VFRTINHISKTANIKVQAYKSCHMALNSLQWSTHELLFCESCRPYIHISVSPVASYELDGTSVVFCGLRAMIALTTHVFKLTGFFKISIYPNSAVARKIQPGVTGVLLEVPLYLALPAPFHCPSFPFGRPGSVLPGLAPLALCPNILDRATCGKAS
jgi:hypothetical protein